MLLFVAPPVSVPPALVAPMATSNVPEVPFYSQFKDIRSPTWQKVGCGIASLAMIVDYYRPNAVSANALLKQGIAAGAYDYNAGWIYAGLIGLSRRYGLDGQYHDLSKLDAGAAFQQFKTYVQGGPVILSVHYKFDPKSTIPHLVVIDGIDNGVVYYNDPAAKTGEKRISVADFLKGWKRKVIVIRPVKSKAAAVPQNDGVALRRIPFERFELVDPLQRMGFARTAGVGIAASFRPNFPTDTI